VFFTESSIDLGDLNCFNPNIPSFSEVKFLFDDKNAIVFYLLVCFLSELILFLKHDFIFLKIALTQVSSSWDSALKFFIFE